MMKLIQMSVIESGGEASSRRSCSPADSTARRLRQRRHGYDDRSATAAAATATAAATAAAAAAAGYGSRQSIDGHASATDANVSPATHEHARRTHRHGRNASECGGWSTHGRSQQRDGHERYAHEQHGWSQYSSNDEPVGTALHRTRWGPGRTWGHGPAEHAADVAQHDGTSTTGSAAATHEHAQRWHRRTDRIGSGWSQHAAAQPGPTTGGHGRRWTWWTWWRCGSGRWPASSSAGVASTLADVEIAQHSATAAAGCSDTAQQSATDGGLYQTAHRSAAATAESARRHAAGTAGAHPAAAHAQQYAATVDGPARNSRRYAEYSAAGAAAAPASTAGHGPARTGSTAWHDGWCQHEYWLVQH